MQRVMQEERMRDSAAHGKTRESHMSTLSCTQRTSLLMVQPVPSQHTADANFERKCSRPVERGDEHSDCI